MSAVARVLEGFFDDASLFPPASVSLPAAVPDHHAHRSAWYGPLVGTFVCPWPRVRELVTEVPVRLSLTFPDGPAGLGPALAALAERPDLQLAAVEVTPPDDLTPRDVLRVLDEHLPPHVAGYLEVPPGDRRSAVLDALAVTRHRAALRTGGATPHPSEWELAEAVRAAVQRGVPFACAAGRHRAVRNTDGQREQHGFLNLLLAVDVARHGADVGAVAAVLASRAAEAIGREIARVAAIGRLADVRTHLVSIGTCSIADTVADLVALDLLAPGGG